MEGKKTYSLVYLSYPERIHQAQAAAAKARKALQQKPKPAAKPVSPQEKNKHPTAFTGGNNHLPIIVLINLCFYGLEVWKQRWRQQNWIFGSRTGYRF